MPPPSTELVLYQHEASYDKRNEASPYSIPWSPFTSKGNHLVKPDVIGALLTSWGPNLLSTSLLGHLRTRPQNSSGFTIAINVIKAQFILFRRRIDALEAQNDDLRHDNVMCHSDVGALESELTRLRADYYSELFQRRQETRRVNEDKEEIKALKAEIMMQRTEIMILKDKNAQAEIFMQAMLDLKLHHPILQTACKSIKDGGDAEEALVNAVLKASACKDSAWSRIIPAVVGPRSPEHYLSALDLALKARRDLHERQKVSGFWKLKAMADPSNVGTLTPSSSQISDICEELVQQQEVSKRSTSSNDGRIDAELYNVPAPNKLPPAETITQMQGFSAESKEIQSDLSLTHSIDSVDTQMTATEALDAVHDSDSDSVVVTEDDDTDEAYLSSGRESIISTVTVKPMHITKSESVVDDSQHQPVNFEYTVNAVQDAGPFNQELIADKPSTPLHDEVPISVESSTPNKSPQPPKVSSFVPVAPRQTLSPNCSTVSFQSPSQSILPAKPRVKEHADTRANSDLLVSPVKPSAIRSRLSTPQNYTAKRPALQSINLNVPGAAHHFRETCDTSDDDDQDKVSSSHNLRTSSTKNLRKRRGVILVERTDVGDNVKPGSKASTTNAILSDSSALPMVAPNVDAFGPDSEDLSHQIVEDNDFGDHLARDASDVEQSPVLASVASNIEGTPLLPLSESQNVQSPLKSCSPNADVQRPAVPSPTSAVISRFIENFSDSDLGSLEMTDDEGSDSDCENIRRVQQNVTPVRPKRTIRHNDEGGDDDGHGGGQLSASISNMAVVSALASSESTSASVSSAPRSRSATPFSKSLSWLSMHKKDKASLSASSSGSSYTTSTASGSDGQTNKKQSKLPLFGLARRFGRTSTSPPPANEIDTSSELPTNVDDSLSHVPPVKENQSFSIPVNPTSKPSFWNKRNYTSNDGSKDTNPVTLTKTVPPSKIPKSDSAQKRSPAAGLKPSVGQSFIRRLSNVPITKSKPIPQPIPQSTDSESTYLAPPSPQYTKPRSHTINTVSPLPPSLSTPSPQSLMAGSTKPRSHTVNTYSPTTRSPLSRLAGDTSTNTSSTPTKESRIPPGSSLPRSLVPKTTISSPKNTAKNTTVPLRVNKSPAKNQPSSHETEPKPPTAAFMRPAANPSSTTRRMTNSIAPLIPNWTPSAAANGLTPKQCRSMFRNRLSMVVR